MADDDKDYNDLLDDIVLCEENQHRESYEEGFQAGVQAGNPEGYHLGYHRGAEIGRELGYYQGIVSYHRELTEKGQYSERIIQQLSKVTELIGTFPATNSEEHDILSILENIRAQYRKTCALLKIPSHHPYGGESQAEMDPIAINIRKQLDSICCYLKPLLPMANSHMVEFYTERHWESLLPEPLRKCLEQLNLNEALDTIWKVAESGNGDNKTDELSNYVSKARRHCLNVDNEICLSVDEFRHRIRKWGGDILPEIDVKEFVSPKKRYEVQRMSSLVASLGAVSGATVVVDVGGGRGALPAVVMRGRGRGAGGGLAAALTVDCDEGALRAGRRRDHILQKQWHAICKRVDPESSSVLSPASLRPEAVLHRYLLAYVTPQTDLSQLLREGFPEYSHLHNNIILTGLHTCGELGPSSLRLLSAGTDTECPVSATLTVPCCYHLLTEESSAQPPAGESTQLPGFPMTQYMRGAVLGRNARMLAAQSVERVTSQRHLPADTLHYRAMLQVIIKKHVSSSNQAEGKLKQISAKCQNFKDYFKAADAILKLNLFDSLSDSYLTEFTEQYESEKKRLVLFYLLRLCLAQVVETVILLDRLLFLYEKGIENAFLVKLFDPVVSPRCHGIVALRRNVSR